MCFSSLIWRITERSCLQNTYILVERTESEKKTKTKTIRILGTDERLKERNWANIRENAKGYSVA